MFSRIDSVIFCVFLVLFLGRVAASESEWTNDGESVLNQIHDPGYRCTNQTFGNGLERIIAFGRQDNLRTNDKVEDTGVIDELNFDYTYAADKNVLTETSANGLFQDLGFTATSDSGNRVASWNRADQFLGARETQTWNYDDAGNWNSTTIDGNTENRTNNTSDEATVIDGNNLSYDARGNLLHDEDNQDQQNSVSKGVFSPRKIGSDSKMRLMNDNSGSLV